MVNTVFAFLVDIAIFCCRAVLGTLPSMCHLCNNFSEISIPIFLPIFNSLRLFSYWHKFGTNLLSPMYFIIYLFYSVFFSHFANSKVSNAVIVNSMNYEVQITDFFVILNHTLGVCDR